MVEEIANAHDQKGKERNEDRHERGPNAALFVSNFVLFPNAVQTKEIIRKVQTPRADLLIAETGVVDLLSHPLLHKCKRTEQDNCDDECDFIQRHSD